MLRLASEEAEALRRARPESRGKGNAPTGMSYERARGMKGVADLPGVALQARQARDLVRAEFLALRQREFVEAARALGMRDTAIAVRVILPNALSPVIVAATLGVAEAILLESGLAFFGLGDPDLMSWGLMLQNAQGFLRRAWWMAVFPGLAIFVAVLAFNILGDGINDALNPRLRQRT